LPLIAPSPFNVKKLRLIDVDKKKMVPPSKAVNLHYEKKSMTVDGIVGLCVPIFVAFGDLGYGTQQIGLGLLCSCVWCNVVFPRKNVDRNVQAQVLMLKIKDSITAKHQATITTKYTTLRYSVRTLNGELIMISCRSFSFKFFCCSQSIVTSFVWD